MPHPTPRLRALASGALLLGVLSPLAGSLPGPLAAPALAATGDEVYSVPANGIFTFSGHGWGHGRGMSQYGADGAATTGTSSSTIVSTYYRNTGAGTLTNSPIRVWLTGDDGTDMVVAAASGLKMHDMASDASLTLPTGPSKWRILADSSGLHLQSWDGTKWAMYAVGGKTTFAGPVRMGAPATSSNPAPTRLIYPDGSARDYRGFLAAYRSGSTGLLSVVQLTMEDYLKGVVPRESPSSWPAAALQAQAIAARSYSAYKRAHTSSSSYDICDSTMCQVFGGTRVISGGTTTVLETSATNAAVDATAGQVRTYNGQPIFAEFSSSNGGWSVDGGAPYLVAQQDSWDGITGSSVHSWNASMPASVLQAKYPAVGTLVDIRVTQRDGNGDWGGRVLSVVLDGKDAQGKPTTVSLNGSDIYHAHPWPTYSDGLRSNWWTVTSVGAPPPGAAPTISGPATADRGSRVTLSGTAPAGSTLGVWFNKQNVSGYTKRRSITVPTDGHWSTTYIADVDYHYYATVGNAQSAVGLTQARGTTISGPATAPLGSSVGIGGLAAPGSTVVIYFHRRNVSGYTARRWLTADGSGRYATSYIANDDYRYYAVAAGYTSPAGLTQIA